jgi:hypothetical protein
MQGASITSPRVAEHANENATTVRNVRASDPICDAALLSGAGSAASRDAGHADDLYRGCGRGGAVSVLESEESFARCECLGYGSLSGDSWADICLFP